MGDGGKDLLNNILALDVIAILFTFCLGVGGAIPLSSTVFTIVIELVATMLTTLLEICLDDKKPK